MHSKTTRGPVAIATLSVSAGFAMSAPSLEINGSITVDDSISYAQGGEGDPFYYDMVRISVDTDAAYNFDLSGNNGLAPWSGLYEGGTYDPDNFDLMISVGIFSSSIDNGEDAGEVFLAAGEYDLVLSSYWYNEDQEFAFGDYTMLIVGPDGSNISIVPAPGGFAGVVVGLGLGFFRRRR